MVCGVRTPIGTVERVVRGFFFLIGAAKTGTTLLARMLDQQPAVAVTSETYFLKPNFRSSIFHPESDVASRHGFGQDEVEVWRSRALATVTTESGKLAPAISEPSHCRPIISEILERFAEIRKAQWVGDKWPYWHDHLGTLISAFPDGKFLYNVRDPRAVWNSGNRFRGRNLGGKVLEDYVRADKRLRTYIADDRFHIFRYEDLVANPSHTMAEIAKFIGFEFQPDAIDYDENLDDYSNRWNWVPEAKTQLDRRLTDKWRREMPVDEQHRVTESCADIIQRYGYDPTIDTPVF